MSTQTIQSALDRTSELAVPNITVVAGARTPAANAEPANVEPARTPGARSVLASLPALIILVASAWAAGTDGAAGILQASVWASALVFFALAIEHTGEGFEELLAIGAGLTVLGVISATLAAEIAVVAAAIVAAWVYAAIIRF